MDSASTGRVPSPPRDRRASSVGWRRVVAVNAVVILAILLLAEGAVRMRQAIKYGTAATVEEYYTRDPGTGLRIPIAGLRRGHIAINGLGFRGPEIATPKPADTVRIAFLGASTTWCGEVSGNEFTWPHLVTQALAREFPGVRFDYVNAGVPGYTVQSVLKNLELRVAPLRPDVIVIYEAANDLSGEMRALAARQGLIAEAKMQEMSWPSRYSLLWHLVEKNLRVIAAQRATADPAKRIVADPQSLGDEYRRDLTALVDRAREIAPLVALATFSIHPRRGQSPEALARAMSSAPFYMPFVSSDLLIDAYARYNEIGRDVATRAGALLIEGEDEIPGDPAHFTDTVHFTDEGSRVMAERIDRALSASPILRDLAGPDRSAGE